MYECMHVFVCACVLRGGGERERKNRLFSGFCQHSFLVKHIEGLITMETEKKSKFFSFILTTYLARYEEKSGCTGVVRTEIKL